MNGYICFYFGERAEIYANTHYEAVLKAKEHFKAKGTSRITAILAERLGEQVTNTIT